MRRALLVAAVLLVACVFADDLLPPDAQPKEPDFGKMRVKQLQALLDERGVKCQGCSEKEHLVDRAKETFHLPIKPPQEAKPPGAEGGIPKPDFTFTADPSNENSASTEEIMRKIRNSMPGAKFNYFDKSKLFAGKSGGMKMGDADFQAAVEKAKAARLAAEAENVARAEAEGIGRRKRPGDAEAAAAAGEDGGAGAAEPGNRSKQAEAAASAAGEDAAEL